MDGWFHTTYSNTNKIELQFITALGKFYLSSFFLGVAIIAMDIWSHHGCSYRSDDLLEVYVALASGKRKKLSIPQSSKVGDLRLLAQESFEQAPLKLVSAAGRVLSDPAETLKDALQDGDHVTTIAQTPMLARTGKDFALWCCGDNAVHTRGDPRHGGDSSAIQD